MYFSKSGSYPSDCILIDMDVCKIFLSSKCPWLGLKDGSAVRAFVALAEDPGSDSDQSPALTWWLTSIPNSGPKGCKAVL